MIEIAIRVQAALGTALMFLGLAAYLAIVAVVLTIATSVALVRIVFFGRKEEQEEPR